MTTRLALTRSQILAFRRRVAGLDARLPPGAESLRRAAWAGLQDSMPRAGLLSIHARVDGAVSSTWEDPSLVQVWGPRFSAYVVPAPDRAVFTLGRMPEAAARQALAHDIADQLEAFLDGRRLGYDEAGDGLGVNPNRLRYAAPTGRVLIRWDGARRPTIWTAPAPDVDPADARLELARRYVHVFGPTTAGAFAEWAGVGPGHARTVFDALAGELVPVTTPIGDAWILGTDERAVIASESPPATARLLPSGDTWFLLQGRDRELLVPDAGRRGRLWTSRVWPGAVLVGGEVVGTWRRAQATVSIDSWRAVSPGEREAVEAEAASLPLPGIEGAIVVRWDDEVGRG
ncbi:MAG TPA: crosslink repair DNA glycosylase YcaQ family protein [Candidatus Limnocylindrales bacterium]